jgi:hypothetical protein
MRSGWLQLTQAPVQARLQQTPSLQNPDSQSPGSSHTLPAARFAPQAAPEQQTPCWQVPVVQSPGQAQACPGARLGASAERQTSDGESPPSDTPTGASVRAALVPGDPPTPAWGTPLV